jgi:hypothetical protein
MCIGLIVLVPLAAGIALLGQYTHIKQVNEAAARQAAWTVTVDPAMAQGSGSIPDASHMQSRLRATWFGDAKAPVNSSGYAGTRFDDPMLETFAGHPLLRPIDVSLTTYKQEASPSWLDKGFNQIGRVTKKLHIGSNLPPNDKGLVTAEVHSRTRKVVGVDGRALDYLEDLASRRLDFSAKTVLLADAWNASGGGERMDGEPDHDAPYYNRTITNVIRPMVPTALVPEKMRHFINKAGDILGNIPFIDDVITPNFDKFELGRMAPDVVPRDKLVEYQDVH